MKKAMFLLLTMSLVVAPASFAEDIADIDIADVTADLNFLAGFGLPTDINGKRGADIGEVTCFKSTFSGNSAMNAAYVANKTLALADIGPVVRDTFGADEAATVVAIFMCLGDVAETGAFMTDPDVAALGATWTQAGSYDTSQAGLDTGQVAACNGGGGEGEPEGSAEGEGEGAAEGEGEGEGASEGEPSDCDITPCPDFDGLGSTFYGPGLQAAASLPFTPSWNSSDLDGILLSSSNIIDSWEVALFAYHACRNDGLLSEEAACAYEANLATLQTEGSFTILLNALGGIEVTAAALSISTEFQLVFGSLGFTGSYVVAGSGAKAGGEPFSPSGDLDGDGISNLDESLNVFAEGGNAASYVQAASSPLLNGSEPFGLPVAGAPALALLVGAIALVATMRRR